MVWSRAIRPPNQLMRIGDHGVNAGDLLRQRFTAAEILTCQDLLAKNYDPAWINKTRVVRALPGKLYRNLRDNSFNCSFFMKSHI